METQSRNSIPKWLLVGCGCLGMIGMVGLVLVGAVSWWFVFSPESGVKLGNEMDEYALQYIERHKLLDPGEEVLAYYDDTILMNGSEAAILTNDRIMYVKDDRTTAFPLTNVRDIRHRTESMVGDIIEVEDDAGQILKIEIAPLNQGETFLNALMNAWHNAKEGGPGR